MIVEQFAMRCNISQAHIVISDLNLEFSRVESDIFLPNDGSTVSIVLTASFAD
jgi:hypothetical protein